MSTDLHEMVRDQSERLREMHRQVVEHAREQSKFLTETMAPLLARVEHIDRTVTELAVQQREAADKRASIDSRLHALELSAGKDHESRIRKLETTQAKVAGAAAAGGGGIAALIQWLSERL